MPNFAASLRDGSNNVALSVSGTIITIGDYSNYIASTELNHELARFHQKVIIVKKYGESTGYVFATGVGYDALLLAPSTYTNPALYPPIETNYTFTDDAIYEVTLIAVPIFVKSSTYQLGDCVIASGKIYYSNVNANTYDPTLGAATWDLIWDSTTDSVYDMTVVEDRYQATEYIAVNCSLWECFADLVYTVNCQELNTDCDDVKLCTNDKWRKAMRLIMILDSMQTIMNNEDIDRALELLNQGRSICTCCS